jgi:pre-mRNA-splicing factor ATP-dependent RNA helicase DHX15/PRP43
MERKRKLDWSGPGPSAADAAALPVINPLNGKPFSKRYYEILETRKKLPVWQFLDQLDADLRKNQVVIVEGETGRYEWLLVVYCSLLAVLHLRCCTCSGKTTQIGSSLVHAGFGVSADGRERVIACTQPRRVAAMSIAQRVADEMDVPLGEEVGYTIRFEDKSGPKTKLKCVFAMPASQHLFRHCHCATVTTPLQILD